MGSLSQSVPVSDKLHLSAPVSMQRILCQPSPPLPIELPFAAAFRLFQIQNEFQKDAPRLLGSVTFGGFSLCGRGESPAMPDNRTDYQLYTSIKNYLLWRSGADWRRSSERNHPDRRDYLAALNWLNGAWNSPVESCPCVYCNPIVSRRHSA